MAIDRPSPVGASAIPNPLKLSPRAELEARRILDAAARRLLAEREAQRREGARMLP